MSKPALSLVMSQLIVVVAAADKDLSEASDQDGVRLSAGDLDQTIVLFVADPGRVLDKARRGHKRLLESATQTELALVAFKFNDSFNCIIQGLMNVYYAPLPQDTNLVIWSAL